MKKTKKDLTRNKNDEYEISADELLDMLTHHDLHGYGYYHLTVWSSLCKMLERVAVPDDTVAHRMFHLGAAVNMNDESDKRCGKGVYFASFSFGPPENISMWTNYGIPNQEAVRIRIPKYGMEKWSNDFYAGRIKVYGVDSDGSLKPLTTKATLELVDVAYWSKKQVGENCDDENEGLFYYDYDKYRLDPCIDVEQFKASKPYCFKEFGWNYERETRLVLKFDEDLADQYSRVAVPFDDPLNFLEDNFPKYVWQGPWFSQEHIPDDKAAGHSLSEAQESLYKGKVKMRSVCDSCPERGKDTCKCPHQGER